MPAPINKSPGTTTSEKYLAQLAEHTFLDLWSYPNLYRDVVVNGRRTGKELCDLLVVCGDNVIIFSDKYIEWPNKDDVNVSWIRWYKKAVEKSIKQIRGAERWIKENSDRIFLDQECTQPLPIALPSSDKIRMHSVAVALGASEACSKFFNGDPGSFMIVPAIKNDAHIKTSSEKFLPFCIGDVDTTDSFIHVMNEVSLDVVMREMDTITDFAIYLDQKADFIRSGFLSNAAGEEELLTYYLNRINQNGEHDFLHPESRPWTETDGRLVIDVGMYKEMLSEEYYAKKKEADLSSYLWDELIKTFTTHIINGTSIVPDGGTFIFKDNEIALKHMAHEPRLMRRMHGDAIEGLLKASNQQSRTMRAVLPDVNANSDRVGYVFMTLKRPETLKNNYEQYRSVRIDMLYAYCLGMLMNNRHVSKLIGIAFEPLPEDGDSLESSEDMIYMEQSTEWSESEIAEVTEKCREYSIFGKGMIKSDYTVVEYPTDLPDNSFKAKPLNSQY
jgi:hypothetical protein